MSVNKLTLTSLDVPATVKQLEILFGRDIVEKTVADPKLKKRGIKWFQFFNIDLHLVPVTKNKKAEFKRLYDEQLKIDRSANDYGILSHVGVTVADLTPYIILMRRYNMEYQIILRADGVYQCYIFLDGVIPSYILELDSRRMTLIDAKIKKFT
jgi:hypothetical protein